MDYSGAIKRQHSSIGLNLVATQEYMMVPSVNNKSLFSSEGVKVDLTHLTLESTLADLPTHTFEVNNDSLGEVVAKTFTKEPHLPGVVILDGDGDVDAIISRGKFLEQVGRAFGVEVYLSRPIRVMMGVLDGRYLELPHHTSIQEAASMALNRPVAMAYEPILVTLPNGRRALLDVYILLLAQSKLLKLVYSLEQNRRQLADSLRKTGKALTSTLELEKVTKRILKELSKVVWYKRGTVLLKEEERLRSIAKRGFPDNMSHSDLQVPLQAHEDDVFYQIATSKKPMIVDDVTKTTGWQQLDGLDVHHSWLGVPLISYKGVIGMLSLTRPEPNAFNEDDLTVVRAFAGQAAVALENARLYRKITKFKDQLEVRVEERTIELNRAYDILEKLDRTKSNFIEISAHELRTPLTVIKGYAQVMNYMPNIQGDDKSEEMIEGILAGVDRLYRIVNSMLDVAKIDSNSLNINREEVFIPNIIYSLINQLKYDLQKRAITINLINDLKDVPSVNGDATLLNKVFYGVLVNAIKYTPDGGTVTLECICLEDGMVQTAVKDSGIGIDPDHHELIFEKFYQTGEVALHSSGVTKFKAGGPGLGLAVAKGIVEAHDGRIWVESDGYNEEAFPGSTFYICLPAIT